MLLKIFKQILAVDEKINGFLYGVFHVDNANAREQCLNSFAFHVSI